MLKHTENSGRSPSVQLNVYEASSTLSLVEIMSADVLIYRHGLNIRYMCKCMSLLFFLQEGRCLISVHIHDLFLFC